MNVNYFVESNGSVIMLAVKHAINWAFSFYFALDSYIPQASIGEAAPNDRQQRHQ